MMRTGRAILLILSLLMFLVVYSQRQLDRHRTPEMELQEILHLPDGKILKTISLGYNSVLSDLLWIKSVLYFGKHTLDEDNPFYRYLAQQAGVEPETEHEEHEGEEHHHSEEFLARLQRNEPQPTRDATLDLAHDPNLQHIVSRSGSVYLAPYIYPILWRVVELDPNFIYPYLFGGFTVLHETGDVEEAYALLQFGRQHNPNRWEFPFYLGYIDLFYNGRTGKALEWLSEALARPDHPAFLERLYVSLTRATSQTAHIIEYLKALYQSSEDQETRERILKILQKLAKSPGPVAQL